MKRPVCKNEGSNNFCHSSFQLKQIQPLVVEKLPMVIKEPYPYIILRDLKQEITRLAPVSLDKIHEFENIFSLLIKKSVDKGIEEQYCNGECEFADSNFFAIDQDQFREQISKKVMSHLQTTTDGIIILERGILDTYDSARIFRLNVSRGVQGLETRPGFSDSVKKQMSKLKSWVKNDHTKLILVDDVLGLGGTLLPIIYELRTVFPKIPLEVIVGVAIELGPEKRGGLRSIKEKTGIDVYFLTQMHGTISMGVKAISDSTFLRGKIGNSAKERTIRYPHILPFSNPPKRSSQNNISLSRKFLDVNRKLVQYLDVVRQKPLMIKDLPAIPYTNIEKYKVDLLFPALDMPVVDYLNHAARILKK
jgi:hypothetical protein